jgi:hypothetical protein
MTKDANTQPESSEAEAKVEESKEETTQVEESKEEATSEESTEESSEESTEEESQEPSIDYKALAEKRLEAIKRMDKTYKEVKKTKDDDSGESTPSEAKPDLDISDIVKQQTNAAIEAYKRESAADVIDTALEDLTDNIDERDLIKLVYEHEIKPSGFSKSAITTDLKKAMAIANLPKLEAQLIKKAEQKAKKSEAESQQMKSASASGGVGRKPPAKIEKRSASEQTFLDSVDRHIKKQYGS